MPKPLDGNVKVITIGVPRRLVALPSPVARVDIRAAAGNVTDIFIGTEFVRATVGDQRGFRLVPKAVLTLEAVDLYDWWIDGLTLGDYVHWGAIIA